jgi:hypothetical protein
MGCLQLSLLGNKRDTWKINYNAEMLDQLQYQRKGMLRLLKLPLLISSFRRKEAQLVQHFLCE